MPDALSDELFPQQCGCADCSSAVSPAAYVAALLDYVLKHVRSNNLKFDLAFLDTTFHQGFSALPSDCEAVDTQVRQVRYCVEQLRSYLGARPLADPLKETALADAERDYRFAAYTSLLGNVGSSYEEIRNIRSAAPEARKALAERLGIALSVPRPGAPGDQLDQLFLDPAVLTERDLETVFGLADSQRNPLSAAAKHGDDAAQLTRWNLSKAQSNQNTDADGFVHISLAQTAANVFRVEIFRDNLRTLLVAAGERASATGAVKLASANESGLSGVVEIAYTADSATIAIAVAPTLLAWQLQQLRTIWTLQDLPADAYSLGALPTLPLIDPDLIGPDDFRHPVPKANAADPDQAFDLWLRRRQALDAVLQGMRTAREANGLELLLKQTFGNPLPDFDALLFAMTKGSDAGEIATAKSAVAALGLTLESFTQLMAIRSKEQLAKDPRHEKVSDGDWEEFYAILLQVGKVRQFDAWRTEETNSGVLLGPRIFWQALTEPKVGEWPPESGPGGPMIDPALTKLADLPDSTAGKAAAALWKARTSALDQIPRQLKAEREQNGLDAMLRMALGHPNPGDALQHDLNTLKTDLASPDPGTQAAVAKKLEQDLHLTVDQFKRLMAIVARPSSTATEWGEVYAMLAPAHKIKHEYPAWVQAEAAAGLKYWSALKTRLPRWRAVPEARRAWQEALRTRSERPIIDPAVIGADDLLHVVPGDPAFDLWKSRHDQGVAALGQLKTTREAAASALAGLDEIIALTLKIDAADLALLDTERLAGQSIEPRLAQYNLSNGGFTFVMRMRALAKASETITAAEWDTVYATIAQAARQRDYAAQRAQEAAANIILAPHLFRLADVIMTPLPFLDPAAPSWLSSWQTRRDWQDTLRTRIDQQASATAALRSAIGAVEESTLTALRDSLVAASDAPGLNLEERAEWITDRLLADARAGACQISSRTALAIETLQTLLFDLRTGQFKQLLAQPLSLVADHFDEEWKWIGSYATWRAPTFVTLYPENILQPNLLRPISGAFAKLIDDTRGVRLTPDSACRQAKAYAGYFQDVCSLEIEATCQATTIFYSGEGCARTVSGKRMVFYMFARGPSGKVYWSAYDLEGNGGGFAQTLWREVEGLGDMPVLRVIGALPYRRLNDDILTPDGFASISAFVHLFCMTGDGTRKVLKLARLNLDDFGVWSDSVKDLSQPKPQYSVIAAFDIVPVQVQTEYARPTLVYYEQLTDRFYYRPLDAEGLDWEAGDWAAYMNLLAPSQLDARWEKLKAVVDINASTWFVRSDRFSRMNLDLGMVPGNGETFKAAKVISMAEPINTLLGVLAGRGFFSGGTVDNNFYVFWKDTASGLAKYKLVDGINNFPPHSALTDLMHIVPHTGIAPFGQQMLAYKRNKNAQAYYIYQYSEAKDKLIGAATLRAAPRVQASLNVPLRMPAAQLQQRRQDIIKAFALNDEASASVRRHLQEAYYFVPLHLALALHAAGHYVAALDCFRTIYDYEAPVGQRNIYYGLELDAKLPELNLYQQADNWLLDPLDPHTIAANRRFAYTRFTLMSLVRCCLDYADSEFGQETGEEQARARTLYLTALSLLTLPELHQKLGQCDDLVASLKIAPGKDIPPEVPAAVTRLLEDLTSGLSIDLGSVVKNIETVFSGAASWDMKLVSAKAIAHEAIAKAPVPAAAGAILARQSSGLQEKYNQLFTKPALDIKVQLWAKNIADAVFGNKGGVAPPAKPAPAAPPTPVITPSFEFCVPTNPILKSLRLHAELNLYKLRTCRNIAGMKRQLDPYAAPTDATSGLPTIGAGGQLSLPGTSVIRPTVYRYPVLMERARQLAQMAAQMEGAMYAELQQRDVEAANLNDAKQQLKLAQAGVQLQSLRIVEANSGVRLAELQRDRARIQLQQYQQWIAAGFNEYEKSMLANYRELQRAQVEAARLGTLAQILQGFTTAAAGGATGAAAAMTFASQLAIILAGKSSEDENAVKAQIAAQAAAVFANYERRLDEWEFQQSLATHDIALGEQQITVAGNQVNVVTQEKAIAELQSTHAKDTIQFLTTKFTSISHHEWMSGILERVYRYFLQQAAAMAKLAHNQLAFQRQEIPPSFFQSDYWQTPGDSASSSGNGPDRRGLTGSARLFQDLQQLDQFAFDTDKRKLQLTKTISLAQLAPLEFQQFRQTGVMLFSTSMELFDRGFPGHYLRLIRRVRTTVVALIPPVGGIHATLTCSGLTRTVIGPEVFQTVPIRRDPEFIALTSPINASGVFEMDALQPDMLLPFEGNGVDGTWEFRMPKAANAIDYRSCADVLLTIEYTALQNVDYRQQVIQSLSPSLKAERAFSFCNQFADQWYDLANPDQSATPMTVRFNTTAEDFPPNVTALKMQQILLYFARADGTSFELPVTGLRFTETGKPGTIGGSATPVDGLISTRRGNAGAWTALVGKSPVGEWELSLPNLEEVRRRFRNGELDDILLVISYAGRTPEWPA